MPDPELMAQASRGFGMPSALQDLRQDAVRPIQSAGENPQLSGHSVLNYKFRES